MYVYTWSILDDVTSGSKHRIVSMRNDFTKTCAKALIRANFEIDLRTVWVMAGIRNPERPWESREPVVTTP